MNVESIKNGEPQIFPYLNGELLCPSGLGYTTVKQAMKYVESYCRHERTDDIYKDCWGSKENYDKIYISCYKLEDALDTSTEFAQHYNLTWGAVIGHDKESHLKVWTKGCKHLEYIHIGAESKYKDITDEIVAEIKRIESKYCPLMIDGGIRDLDPYNIKRIKSFDKRIECVEEIKTFEEKYGMYPMLKIDDKPFDKAKMEWIKKNVEFKTGLLEINIVLDDK